MGKIFLKGEWIEYKEHVKIGQLVRLLCGQWTINDDGEWIFLGDPTEVEHFIVASTSNNLHTFFANVRAELLLPTTKPLLLTYRLPDSMMETQTLKEAPQKIINDEDVECLMSIQEWRTEVSVSVTYGAVGFAKFDFLSRSSFTIGDTTYLAEGITEKQHLAAINEEVVEEQIKCNGKVLREIVSEEKLVLLYRLSFEIEKAKHATQLNISQTKRMGEEDSSGSNGKRIHCEEMLSNSHRRGIQNNPIPSKGGTVLEHSRKRRFMEEGSEDATFYNPTVGDILVETEYWETDGVEGCDDIINLSSELNLEDEVSPICDHEFVDIGGSSTGSTTAAAYGYVGDRANNINITIEHRYNNPRPGNPGEESEASQYERRMTGQGGVDDSFSEVCGPNGLY
ncbi:hypothetical protein N665_0974s0003 [Sinapis alba]|nr:hypothetical protein N665_0974s0003 [Sinapis alba]